MRAVFFIVYIITLFKNIKDKNTSANVSQLHTRLQYNFYWLFRIQLQFTANKLNK